MSLLSQALSLPRSVFQTVVPQSIPSHVWIPEGTQLPTITRASQPRLTAAEIFDRARAAVLARRREQEQQGVIPYVPANPALANDELRTRLTMAGLPTPAMYYQPTNQAVYGPAPQVKNLPVSVQQRGGNSGGVVATYSNGDRVVTGRYGTGSATSKKKPMTITEDGKTIAGAKWFQDAANRYNRPVDMGVGNDLYIPEQRRAEFAEGARRLQAAEEAAKKKKA